MVALRSLLWLALTWIVACLWVPGLLAQTSLTDSSPYMHSQSQVGLSGCSCYMFYNCTCKWLSHFLVLWRRPRPQNTQHAATAEQVTATSTPGKCAKKRGVKPQLEKNIPATSLSRLSTCLSTDSIDPATGLHTHDLDSWPHCHSRSFYPVPDMNAQCTAKCSCH